MTFRTAGGMGDYAAAVLRGVTGYYFYPTWSQPVQTTSSQCLPCLVDGQTKFYNLDVYGTWVNP
jgi:hypothetical protein